MQRLGRTNSSYDFSTRPVRPDGLLCDAVARFAATCCSDAEIYLIPRSDGRLLAGATVEESGFDKHTVPDTIQRLRHNCYVARFGKREDLGGLGRTAPGTPDNLPILGATPTPGYYVATGHFRDGILLAPLTAHVIAEVMAGEGQGFDLSAFSAGDSRCKVSVSQGSRGQGVIVVPPCSQSDSRSECALATLEPPTP